jgi:uncharacterized protein YdeI (YjbR/CyaY-like superfamily)
MNETSKLEKSFGSARLWQQEANELRRILLRAGLTEESTWGKPCYTHDGKNICIIQRMNGFLALLFLKGALLKDPDDKQSKTRLARIERCRSKILTGKGFQEQ